MQTIYHAYLLRMRRMENGDRPIWTYTLQSTTEAYQFTTLAELIAFLQESEKETATSEQ